MTTAPADRIGRGGVKLAHALETFAIDVRTLRCADFGCNVGGFTDALLRAGAAHVVAIDTGYGVLDYRLRRRDDVEVRERTNALHAESPSEGVDLVVVDMGWTPQHRCVPAALRWLRPAGTIVTLVKPHYEATSGPLREAYADRVVQGVLPDDAARDVLDGTLAAMADLGAEVLAWTTSPVRGGAKKGRRAGNVEYLAHLRALTPAPGAE